MPINCNQPNVYQHGESWSTEANEYHTLCAAYRTTSLNTKFQETVAAAPADSHGGDHTVQFVTASQGRRGGGGGGGVGAGGGGGGGGGGAVNCQCISVYCSFGARDITLVCS